MQEIFEEKMRVEGTIPKSRYVQVYHIETEVEIFTKGTIGDLPGKIPVHKNKIVGNADYPGFTVIQVQSGCVEIIMNPGTVPLDMGISKEKLTVLGSNYYFTGSCLHTAAPHW